MDTQRGFSEARLISRISLVGLIPLSASIVWGLFTGSDWLDLALRLAGAANFLTSYLLVRLDRIRAARILFPAIGWVLANLALLITGQTTPFAFVGINAVTILLAGAILGHQGLLAFGLLSAGFSGLLVLLSSAGRYIFFSPPSADWLTAGPVFAILVILSYYAFRTRQEALEQAGRRAAEMETLRQASAAVTASLKQEETIDRILEALADVIPHDSAAVQLLDGDELEIIGGHGWQDPTSVVGIRFRVGGDNPNTVVVNTCEPYVLADAPAVHAPFRRPPHDHIRSWLGVPLQVGDRMIGMLSIDHSRPGRYGPSEARLATVFADQVAIALENARLFRSEQQRRQFAAMQQDITQVTSSSLELDDVLTRVSLLTAEATGAHRCSVLLLDEDSGQLELATLQTIESANLPADRELLATAYRQLADRSLPEDRSPVGRARLLDRDELEAWLPADLFESLQSEQVLLAPLVSRGRFLGVLVLDRKPSGQGFDQDPVLLVQAVTQSVAVSIENALLFARMEEMAITDTLTGLYNRRGMVQLAGRELDRAQRYQRPLSVLMLDIDHFKVLNDAHGHLVGDQVLVGLARLLESSVRRVDLLSRHGGEEFVALLPESDLPSAARAAERVRLKVEAADFPTHAGLMTITISVGVAGSDEIGLDLELLVDAADQAMYAAKQAGRNRVWSWQGGRARSAAVASG